MHRWVKIPTTYSDIYCPLVVHGFVQTSYTVTEGSSVEVVFKTNVKNETVFDLFSIQGRITASPKNGTSTTGKSVY